MHAPPTDLVAGTGMKAVALVICEEHRHWLPRTCWRISKRLLGLAGNAPSGDNAVARSAVRALIESELSRNYIAHTAVLAGGPFNRSYYTTQVAELTPALDVLNEVGKRLPVDYAVGVFDPADGFFRATTGAGYAQELTARLSIENLQRENQRASKRRQKLEKRVRWLRALYGKIRAFGNKLPGRKIPPLK